MATRSLALGLCLGLALTSALGGRPSAKDKDLELHKKLKEQAEAMGGLNHLPKRGPEFRGLSGVTRPALQKMLELAELQFQNNMRRRSTRLGDSTPSSLTVHDFEAVMLEPTYSCPVEARLGRWGEGGLWVCLSNFGRGKASATAFSFATGCDTSFEKDLFETLDIRSHLYDFDLSARSINELNTMRFISYHNAGLTGSSKVENKRYRFPSVNWVTLPEAMKDTGVGYADVVKIDCEGCEVDVVKDLAATSNRTHPAVGQILMQVHDVAEWKLPKIKTLFNTLEKLGFRLFHAQANAFYKQHYDVSLIHETLVKPRNVAM